MQYQQANAFQTTRAGAWPVWLIWQGAPAASSLAAVKMSPKNCLLVPGSHIFTCTTHTPVPLPNIQSKTGIQKQPNSANRAPEF